MKGFLRGAVVAACLSAAAIGLPRDAAAQTLTVNANSIGQTLDGMSWGVNLLGWSGTTHPNMASFNELGMKSVRYPSGSPGDSANYFSGSVSYPWPTFCSDMAVAGVPGRNMIINVNYGTGTPQDAANWVQDANVTRRLGIRYWEMGNEVWTPGQDSHGSPGYRPGLPNDPITYANEYVAWRNAMRAVDPNIKLGVDGLYIRTWSNPYGESVVNPRTGQTMTDWESIMFSRFHDLGVTPDFVIYHNYEFASFTESDAGLLSGLDQSGMDLATKYNIFLADINDWLPNPSQVEIHGTEFGFIWDAPGKLSTNLPGALYMAEVLGDSLNVGMKQVNWFCFNDSDTPAPDTDPSKCNLSSSLYGWRIYGQWGIESSAGVPFDRHPEFYISKLLAKFTAEGDVVLGCTSNQTNLRIYSVKHADGTMSILVVNIAPNTDYNNIPINLTGFAAGGNATVWSYGKVNDTAAQNNAAGQDLTQTSVPVSGGTIMMSYPQYSATLMTFGATANTNGPAKVNAAGPAASPFVADADFSGGTIATNWTGAIDTSAAASPAPQTVYQSERYGASTYTFPGLTANASYTVRLHFCENFFTASAQRTFNVAINGVSKLSNFDIFATAGAIHKANVQQFTVNANASGQMVIAFTNVVNNALINGIEVNASVPGVPTGLAATAGSGQAFLSWNASSGATTYNVKRSTVSGSGYATVASPATNSYTNTGLTNGTTYYYVVSAVNSGGESANSAQASATPSAAPQAQIANAATAPVIDGNNTDAVWSAATSYPINNISGTVSSAADLSGSFKAAWDTANLYLLVDVTDDAKVNDSTNPWDDDAIELYLDADHNGGTVYDANDRQVIFGWGDTTPVEGAGRAITGVTFAKADPTGTTYRIEAKIPWAVAAFTPAANAIVGIDVHIDDDDDGGARDGKKMWNDTTDTAYTNPTVFGTGKLVGSSIPAPPTGLTATPGNTQIALAWTASAGATSYNVYRGTAAGGESGTAIVTAVAGTSYTNTGLTNGIHYYYTVKAVNAAGTSGASNEANATPAAAGSLTGSVANTPASVNLTTEGTLDWAHWGLGGVLPGYDHKSTGGTKISNYTATGTVSAWNVATGQTFTYNWTDGTPNTTISNTESGVSVPVVGNNFVITAPADTTQKILKVYCGGWQSRGQITAHLSDGSAVDYVDSSQTAGVNASFNVAYTLTYKAASAGQTLTVTWKENTDNSGNGGGNSSLQAATLH